MKEQYTTHSKIHPFFLVITTMHVRFCDIRSEEWVHLELGRYFIYGLAQCILSPNVKDLFHYCQKTDRQFQIFI